MNHIEIINRKTNNDNLRRVLEKISKSDVKLDITSEKMPLSKVCLDLTLLEKLILKKSTLEIRINTNK